jgi:hypothetical protein
VTTCCLLHARGRSEADPATALDGTSYLVSDVSRAFAAPQLQAPDQQQANRRASLISIWVLPSEGHQV